ncbi:MAG: glycosyltransferase, partial [Deltaproteobacteria bacterium]
MMRILVVMTGGGAGGLQQMAVPYAVALRDAGHEVRLAMRETSPMLADAERQGVAVDSIRWPQRPFPFGWLQTRELRRVMSEFRAEAVVAIAQKGLKQAIGAVGGRLPVLTHVGGTREKVIRKLLGADHLIVTSAEMRDIAVSLGGDMTRMSIVPNFLIGDVVSHHYDRLGPIVIGSLGRLTRGKGFDLMIAAVAR